MTVGIIKSMMPIHKKSAVTGSLGTENALGVDGITKAQYGKNLEDNLHKLPVQLKRTG